MPLKDYEASQRRVKELTANQWLPIESAPEIGEFLVFLPDERTKVQAARKNENGVFVIGDAFAFDLTEPTHWMPLPESPKP